MALFTLGPAVIGISASLVWDRVRYRSANRIRAAAARLLGRLAQPETAGAVASALRDPDAAVRQTATESLKGLLPALEARHESVFDSEAVANLGRALTSEDPELALAVLNSLEAIGGVQAISYVVRAQRHADAKVRGRAVEVLGSLQQRLGKASEQARLLRPSTPVDDPASTLVRAASGNAETDSDLLLRASQTEP